MKDFERRFFESAELRFVSNDGAPPVLRGYAARFNSLSAPLGGFREKIQPGAFANSLLSADVRALWNHDPNYVLGRSISGTLRLQEDENGLLMEVTPPDTQWARDLMVSVARGDVSQQSFGFRTVDDKWEETPEGTIRTLREVQLIDVSPVTYPAYPDTSVAVRRLEQWKKPGVSPKIEHLRRLLNNREKRFGL